VWDVLLDTSFLAPDTGREDGEEESSTLNIAMQFFADKGYGGGGRGCVCVQSGHFPKISPKNLLK
jgi:hypothetical protein